MENNDYNNRPKQNYNEQRIAVTLVILPLFTLIKRVRLSAPYFLVSFLSYLRENANEYLVFFWIFYFFFLY